MTLGLRVTRPESGFGYLELGDRVGAAAAHEVYAVRRFVEKPERARAEAFMAAGNFRWNSGMFAWTVAAIEGAIRTHLPELAAGLDGMMAAGDEVGEAEALAGHYPRLPRVSVDFGVMERASPVWAVAVDFEWSDVGSWSGLAELLPASPAGVTMGEVVAPGSEGCVLISDGPLVAALGVRDLVVVATRDAVLVVPKDQAQRVKELVARLREVGRDDLL